MTIESFHFRREWIMKKLERFTFGTKLLSLFLKFFKTVTTQSTLKRAKKRMLIVRAGNTFTRDWTRSLRLLTLMAMWTLRRFTIPLKDAMRAISKEMNLRKNIGYTPKTLELNIALTQTKKYTCKVLETLFFLSKIMDFSSMKFGGAQAKKFCQT